MYEYHAPIDPKEPLDEKLMVFFSVPDFFGNSVSFWKYVKNKGYRTVWIVADKNRYDLLRQQGIECCYIHDNSTRLVYLEKAKYYVFNREIDITPPKFKGQVYIFIAKQPTFINDLFANPVLPAIHLDEFGYLRYSALVAKYTDIAITTSELMRAYTSSCYGINASKIYATGLPTHDDLMSGNGKENLISFMPQLKKYSTFVGYFPSSLSGFDNVRPENSLDNNIFSFKLFDLKRFEVFLEEHNIAVVFKLHPVDEQNLKHRQFPLPKHCYMINSREFNLISLYEVYNAFDILISEISSVASEFLFLDRPIIFLWDYVKVFLYGDGTNKAISYQSGYLFDDDSLFTPGYRVTTQEELQDALADSITNPNKYKKERDRVRKLLFKYTDANSCARVLDVIENYKPIEDYEYEMFTRPVKKYYEAQISNLNAVLNDRINDVKKLNDELDGINSNFSYKLATIPAKYIYPKDSKRRFFYIMIKNAIRHPILMLKCLNPRNIKAFVKKVRNGEYDRAEALVKYTLYSGNPLAARLVLNKSKYKRGYPKLTLPGCMSPVVSIIIPVFNQWDYTYKCIDSIIKHTNPQYEVIVADDCSTDQTQHLCETIENVVYIRNEQNLRFLMNCNNAAKHAKGKYIFFLNNDTQVQPGWLDPLVQLMERDASVGLTGSKLIYPDGRLQEAGGILWNDGSAWNYGRFDNPEKPDYNYVKEVDYISGAAILVRRSVWEQLGGFDESFAPAYYEDADLAFSIRKAGYKVVYQPKSSVVHFEGISNGKKVSEGQKRYQVANSKRFFEKWRTTLEKENFQSAESVFLARDRSQSKKTILFIDHYVPMFDKDAGSRNTFSYVKLYVELGFKVIFLGDNFFPHQPYTDILEQMGVEVLYGRWYMDHWKDWIVQNGKYINYVYLNRPNITEKYIDIIRENSNARIIYHGVDLHFMRIYARYELTNDKHLLEESQDWKKRECDLFAKSDVILTVSEKEKDVISELAPNKKVVVLPIMYFDGFPEISNFSTRKGILFVGSFAHAPNVDAVIWFVNEIMPMLPPLKLTVVGSSLVESVKALASADVDIKGFVTDEELMGLYVSSRVAVMPIRFGAGVKGKTIEAMHNLIPCVSTSFGIEGLPEINEIIPPRDTAEGFADEIRQFLDSDSLCVERVNLYKEWIRKWFSTERAISVVEEMTKE